MSRSLREELARGRWRGTMPGVIRLAGELGVSRDSVEAAMTELEREGLLRAQGRGRRRVIMAEGERGERPLRVAFCLYDEASAAAESKHLLELRHRLIESGHQVVVAPRGLTELRMEVRRVAKVVGGIEADAWVVESGSREVLEWFAARPVPALAIFGRMSAVPIAGVGPNPLPALLAVTRKLIELGHRRIVMLTHAERRTPGPGLLERAVLNEIESHGIPVGPYNLPNWDDTRGGLHRCLDELFRFTPPTALIIDEVSLFAATQLHLARQGILSPQHVSLVCCDSDPIFDWLEPAVSHIRWDSRHMLRQIVRWGAAVACGKNARRQTHTRAELVGGGTIGVVFSAKA